MQKHAVRLAVAVLTFAIGIGLTIPVLAPYRSATLNRSAPPVSIGPQASSAEETDTSSAVETINRLRRFKSGDAYIPTEVGPLLTRLKHQLRDLISAAINAQENQGKSARSLQASILTDLNNKGVMEEPRDQLVGGNDVGSDYVYGDVYSISIQQPRLHPELLTAITTVGVCCGEDSSFYLFKRIGAQWELVLAQEANNYEDVAGAQGSFSYAISPPDADNNFFVVTANVNPWCTSNWQSLRYFVLRVGPSAYQPRTIASGRESIYLGDGRPYKLAVGEHWLSVHFTGEVTDEEIMRGETARRHILQYTVNGEIAKQTHE